MEHNREIHKINEELLIRVLKVFEQSFALTTDSRKVKQGSIFVALRGENFNGNSFALAALQQGAELVIIDDASFFVDARTVLVEDTLVFLQKFANYYRKTFTIPFLAISGTNGKTTTKELINAVLSKKYITCATQGNLNNQIGVPLTILSVKKECQLAIIEMGASHIGDIEELCLIAEPTCCLLTNVGTAHIEGFGSKEGVLQTKTELYKYVDKRNGKVFVNFDDKGLRKQTLTNPVSYSLGDKTADYCAETINGDSPFAAIKVEGTEINSRLVGSYNAYNILAAYVVGKYFQVSVSDIKSAIEEYLPTNNRSQIKETQNNTLILDCYNANPSSCHFALEAFDKMRAEDKRVFIGAMKELGSVSESEHAAVVKQLLSMSLKEIILVGKEYEPFSKYGSNIKYFENSTLAKDFIAKEEIKHSLILIKGSRATKMEVLQDVL
ncbi:MAG: UDP-N-acetylmuramoyl-tripeptide--D-alanyl-D-alanine ligase [Bacteroidales bacterium]|nr:UDP-N-acetylmuramoyl-tripeptide--D-alanyl-D-alanine ligase [Bacteroidales bacterium]